MISPRMVFATHVFVRDPIKYDFGPKLTRPCSAHYTTHRRRRIIRSKAIVNKRPYRLAYTLHVHTHPLTTI